MNRLKGFRLAVYFAGMSLVGCEQARLAGGARDGGGPPPGNGRIDGSIGDPILDYAVAQAKPGEVTSFVVVNSFGGHPTSGEIPIVARLLQTVRNNYVAAGKARFSTTQDVYNAFIALE